MSSIQLVYINSFRSVWEYEEAFFSEKIDWKSVIGPYCPVCGGSCGYRTLTEYYRKVAELWPPREGMVPVARLQCRGAHIGRTFSMLPFQLIPYHLHTVETILKALLLWREYCRDADCSGTSYEVEQSLPVQSRVTSWQLRKWLAVIRRGFLAAHGELCVRYDFRSVSREEGTAGNLEMVHGYTAAFSRGPPVRVSAVLTALHIYGQITGRFLFGCSSQMRRRVR
jgi:hypothetical protein